MLCQGPYILQTPGEDVVPVLHQTCCDALKHTSARALVMQCQSKAVAMLCQGRYTSQTRGTLLDPALDHMCCDALLLRIAAQLGCDKVALGTSATRMAVRTVAMSAKGSGYALPGAVHFTDSR